MPRQRQGQGGPRPRELRSREGGTARRRGGEDDPEAARRDDAAGRRRAPVRGDARRARGLARGEDGRRRRGAPEPRPPIVPAPEPRRVRRLDQGHAGARHRRRVVPPGRHHQPQLRQHRRRAVDVGHAPRGLPARRLDGEPPRGGRSRGEPELDDLQDSAHGVAARARRGRAVRHARRHFGRAQLSGRW